MKRLFDLLLSIVLVFILSPIFMGIALLIRLNMGSPILFRQLRPGFREEIFVIYKFRTMTNEADLNGELLTDEKRLKRLGKFIRSTSLDELPQLFNVIKGEMSFVGPRPLLVEYLKLYNSEQKKRHNVLPGITGWAQVNGRNAISWNEKFLLDVWYVNNQSFMLDVKILWMTLLKVFKRSGISSSSTMTMDKFKGDS